MRGTCRPDQMYSCRQPWRQGWCLFPGAVLAFRDPIISRLCSRGPESARLEHYRSPVSLELGPTARQQRQRGTPVRAGAPSQPSAHPGRTLALTPAPPGSPLAHQARARSGRRRSPARSGAAMSSAPSPSSAPPPPFVRLHAESVPKMPFHPSIQSL